LACSEWDGPGCLIGCRARHKVEDAMRGFKGMKFVGQGTTDADRLADAVAKASAERDRRMDRALDAIIKQMDVFGKKYDKLTSHGTNPQVNSAQGVQMTKQEREHAEFVFVSTGTPDSSRVNATVGTGTTITYLANTDEVALAGSLVFTAAGDRHDTVIGHGQLHIDPATIIGIQVDGSMHLSDTSLQITDNATGRVLMDAFLYRLEYRPGGPYGAAGTIRGSIDIPPSFASGISNLIGSLFLDGMQFASNQGSPTAFWCFAEKPLFSSDGTPTIESGVPVNVTIGVSATPSVPASSTWGLLILAIGIAWAATRILR